MGRGWAGGEGPERGLETRVEEEEEEAGRVRAARGGDFIPRSPGAHPPPKRWAARLQAPLGGPQATSPLGEGWERPSEGLLLSFKWKKPQPPSPAWLGVLSH